MTWKNNQPIHNSSLARFDGGLSAPVIKTGDNNVLTFNDTGKIIHITSFGPGTLTLPVAIGSGAVFHLRMAGQALFNNYVISAPSSNQFRGGVLTIVGEALNPFSGS